MILRQIAAEFQHGCRIIMLRTVLKKVECQFSVTARAVGIVKQFRQYKSILRIALNGNLCNQIADDCLQSPVKFSGFNSRDLAPLEQQIECLTFQVAGCIAGKNFCCFARNCRSSRRSSRRIFSSSSLSAMVRLLSPFVHQ